MKLHFKKGDIVECLNGHKICEVAWTCYKHEPYTTDIFINFTQKEPKNEDKAELLICEKCGEPWVGELDDGRIAFNIKGKGLI